MGKTQGSPAFLLNQYALVSQRPFVDPETGTRWEEVYEGTTAGISVLAATLVSAGAQVRYDLLCPGKKSLVASWGRNPTDDPALEVPTDKWDLAMDSQQESIWAHPSVASEATAWTAAVPGGSPGKYKKGIEDAIAEAAAYPWGVGYPVGDAVFRLLNQGVSYFEVPRPVLRRVRTFTTSYPTRLIQNAAVTVYPRAVLITTFSIPVSVQGQIPANPVTPPATGSVWAWRLRQQSSSYVPATRQYEENLEWDFWAWQTQLYAVAV